MTWKAHNCRIIWQETVRKLIHGPERLGQWQQNDIFHISTLFWHLKNNTKNILLHSFSLIFSSLKIKLFLTFWGIYSDNFKRFLKTITSQISKKNSCKCLKIFSTNFIFRQQKTLLTTSIVILDSGHYLINNPKMFNIEIDDLALKPYIPH